MTKQELLQKFNATKNNKLVASIAIDLVGMASFVIPALGEFGDLIIAPMSAVAIYMVHKTKAGAVLGFAEEIIPFTDIIPTATIIWYKRYHMDKEKTLRAFIADLNQESEIFDNVLNKTAKIDTIEFDESGNPKDYR